MEHWSLSIERCLRRGQKFLSSSFNIKHYSTHVITWILSATFYSYNLRLTVMPVWFIFFIIPVFSFRFVFGHETTYTIRVFAVCKLYYCIY